MRLLRPCHLLAACLFAQNSGASSLLPSTPCPVTLADRFGRPLGADALLLPDWEGYMANPAIRIVVTPPASARFPLAVSLRSSDPLVHFDQPGTVDAGGASRRLTFADAHPQTVYVAAFPQRIKRHLPAFLEVTAGDAAPCRVPLAIVPLIAAPLQRPRAIGIDYAQDRTGFYERAEHRAVFEQAVADWAYFLDGSADAPVRAGDEPTSIWHPDGFKRARLVINDAPYFGHLLYAYGIRSPELRSGGAPALPVLRTYAELGPGRARARSGTVEVEVQGNYNTLGWLPADLPDRDWWRATNLADEPNDLYSILHHEVGHALFFHPAHPGFVRDLPLPLAPRFEVRQRPLVPGPTSHFEGGVDPVSLRGIFGAEYGGRMTAGRWLITRTDLLAIEALGGKLRPVAALQRLTLSSQAAPPALRGRPYAWEPQARGGVPAYDWDLEHGALPPGLTLDRRTGRIAGVPRRPGKFALMLRVRDSADTSAVATRAVIIRVAPPKHLRVVDIAPMLPATRR